MPDSISFTLNGHKRTVEVHDSQMPLLYVLRDHFGLTGPKFGCGLGQCGACTVEFNGTAARSCLVPISAAKGAVVTSIEGIGNEQNPHPLQRAFIAEQAAQCGYCINGMVMTAKSFLARTPHASEEQIKEALDQNLCRCGTHLRIVRAVKRVADGKSA